MKSERLTAAQKQAAAQEAEQAAKQTQTQQVARDNRLGEHAYKFTLLCYQYYVRKKAFPTYEALLSENPNIAFVFTKEKYEHYLTSPYIRDALSARGVLLPYSSEDKEGLGLLMDDAILSEEQMVVADTLLDVLDKRSKLKKLTELGISTQTYNEWLGQPAYRKYVLDRSEQLLSENQHVAHTSLIERVSQGDLNSIKYFNALTGRFRITSQAHAAVQINNNTFGTEATIIRVVEIIQKHVKDPEVLDAIASEILAIVNPNPVGSVGASVGPVIEVKEITQ